jgi:hypothetical protein
MAADRNLELALGLMVVLMNHLSTECEIVYGYRF